MATRLKIGIVGVAHVHTPSYTSGVRVHPEAECIGCWDRDHQLANHFAKEQRIPDFRELHDLLAACDAVVICSENKLHVPYAVQAAQAGKAILCEKPLVTTREEAQTLRQVIAETAVTFMTAFPCPHSPSFKRIQARVAAGELGAIKAVCATNRGKCPGGWFTDPSLSGGGAMIDHVVHVTDLLRKLLGQEPTSVYAQTGNGMYGQEWDDSAMLAIQFEGGVFATLDSSWSRPQSYKTWGDVTMNIVGESGVIEMDMFGQELDLFTSGEPSHQVLGFGSDLDAKMISAFIDACLHGTEVPTTLEDGLKASEVAIAGYESVRRGEVVSLRA